MGSHKLEKIVSECLGLKLQPYGSTAIATNVGYLTPNHQYRCWLFKQDQDCRALVGDMVATVEMYGRPFIQKHSDLLAIYESMRNSNLGVSNMLDYKISAACVLLGRQAEAERYLDSKLKAIEGRSDMAAESFRKFGVRLRARPELRH